jgi:hypothetical protein
MEHGENHFGGAFALVGTRGIGIDGDAATIVVDFAATVGQKSDAYTVAKAGHRLVDRVVDDLPNEVVKTCEACGPDIHTGTFTNWV